MSLQVNLYPPNPAILPKASPNPPDTPTPKPQSADLNPHPISGRPTASPIEDKEFKDKETIWCLIANIMDKYRPILGKTVIQYDDVPNWSDLTPPDGHSSEEGDQVLLGKISSKDRSVLLDEFNTYVCRFYTNTTTICAEKKLQLIARFVQEEFKYALGRNANFSEMIKNHCGNCGDKAGIFKLMVYLVKKQDPTIMKGINVDIIVQGAKDPEYLGPGGELLVVSSQRGMKETTPSGMKETTPNRQLDIKPVPPSRCNTSHLLDIITLPSGQIVLLDLSDSSHLSQEYGKIAMQGIPVYPGDTPVDRKPGEDPFGKNAYLLFLPGEDMGVMRILCHEDYDKYLFKHGENRMFELRLVGIQSCLFGMYQRKSFEEAKQQALAIMRNMRDLLEPDGTKNDLTQDPTTLKSFKPLIDELSVEDRKDLIQAFTKTIEKNEKPFTRPPSTVGKKAFIQPGVIDESKSKEIWVFLNKHGFLSDRGKITQRTIESPNMTQYLKYLSEEKDDEVKRHVLRILQNAASETLLDIFKRIYERSSKEVAIRRIITEVVDRMPRPSRL